MLVTRQPTSNQTPDPGQGGDPVTTPSNTGHDSTTSAAADGGFQVKSCKWSGFGAAPAGQIRSITLKADHSSSGVLVSGGGLPTNLFRIQYSLNGGSAWTDAMVRSDFTALQNATASVALPNNQNLTQVQVRDILSVSTGQAGDTASVTASVSDIKIEVVTVDDAGGGMM